MTTVIMLFILPLGIVFYLFDKKIRRQNREIYENYTAVIKASDLSNQEKIEKIDEMYYHNGYRRVSVSDTTLVVEKKHFNLGVLFIFFGLLAYFGVIFFIIYYHFILKPERVEITL